MKTLQSVKHLGKDAAEARSKAEVGFHDPPLPHESNGPIAALGHNSIAHGSLDQIALEMPCKCDLKQ